MRVSVPTTWRDPEEHSRLIADGVNKIGRYASYNPVKCVDLTNGGSNDLTEVDLALPGDNVSVYSPIYWIHFQNVSSDTGSWFPRIQFQTSGGSFRTANADYTESWHGAAIAGQGDYTSASYIILSASTGTNAAELSTGDLYIYSARDSSSETHVLWQSGMRGNSLSSVGEGHGHVETAEDNDVVRFTLGGVHAFDSGTLTLLMQEECR